VKRTIKVKVKTAQVIEKEVEFPIYRERIYGDCGYCYVRISEDYSTHEVTVREDGRDALTIELEVDRVGDPEKPLDEFWLEGWETTKEKFDSAVARAEALLQRIKDAA
jgi:hypothetical protein